jgi:hypothetical protein
MLSINHLASLLLAATTAACVSTGGIVTDPQDQQALVVQECAIYVAAEQRLAAEGRPVAGLTDGCPAGAAPGDIAATGVAGSATPFSEILFRRMIARGVPNDLANEISTSAAFKNLVAFQAANVG